MHMTVATLAVILGLALLIWSADRFVDGAAATAQRLGMPPLLIGMVIIGFGTSAPELVVSALASWQGNPGIALGNAYGSNIANIGLIIGLTALFGSIAVHRGAVTRELPLLLAVTGLSALLLWNGYLSRMNAWILLGVFCGLMAWTIIIGFRLRKDVLVAGAEEKLPGETMSLGRSLFWLILGLVLLIAASRLLVWGAVEIASTLGVSDLVIGLTIIALGTSLPELASALAATRKGEHDLVLGNVLGSNLFNTLAVVGIAGAIHPLAIPAGILSRDIFFTALLTMLLLGLGLHPRGRGSISPWKGGLLLACYGAYTLILIRVALAQSG